MSDLIEIATDAGTDMFDLESRTNSDSGGDIDSNRNPLLSLGHFNLFKELRGRSSDNDGSDLGIGSSTDDSDDDTQNDREINTDNTSDVSNCHETLETLPASPCLEDQTTHKPTANSSFRELPRNCEGSASSEELFRKLEVSPPTIKETSFERVPKRYDEWGYIFDSIEEQKHLNASERIGMAMWYEK